MSKKEDKTSCPACEDVRASKASFVKEVDETILIITQKMLSGYGAKLKKDHVAIAYEEKIEGQNFKLGLNIFAFGGLYFIQGLLHTGIDASCKSCLANYHELVNDLYADQLAFYGKVILTGNELGYQLTNYYPFSTDPETAMSTWEHFIPILYQSARKDMTRFLTALKQLQQFTKKNGCTARKAVPPSNATH